MGHIDEIGLIVPHIDDNGFLWFTGVGGWDPVILVGQRVEIATRDGVRARRRRQEADPPAARPRTARRCPSCKDLHIDIGAEGRRRGALAGADRRRRRDRRRAGRAAQRPRSSRARWTTASAATSASRRRGSWPRRAAPPATSRRSRSRRRRSPSRGAHTTAYSLRPDVAIAVDVTYATDAPGHDEKELGRHRFGSGAGRSRAARRWTRDLRAALRGRRGRGDPVHGRPRARARPARTRTRCTCRARGIPSAVVSVPLRYMHSPVEMVQLDDVENAARLIAAFARRPGPGHSIHAR